MPGKGIEGADGSPFGSCLSMPPLKLAIVGAGPSSFYVASRLLSLLPPSSSHYDSLRVHMYDRLWAPHGLVRYGVAPDHPEVKVCTLFIRTEETLIENRTVHTNLTQLLQTLGSNFLAT